MNTYSRHWIHQFHEFFSNCFSTLFLLLEKLYFSRLLKPLDPLSNLTKEFLHIKDKTWTFLWKMVHAPQWRHLNIRTTHYQKATKSTLIRRQICWNNYFASTKHKMRHCLASCVYKPPPCYTLLYLMKMSDILNPSLLKQYKKTLKNLYSFEELWIKSCPLLPWNFSRYYFWSMGYYLHISTPFPIF